MISPKGMGWLLIVGILVMSVLGLVLSVSSIWAVAWPRITGNIPVRQVVLWENETGIYPTIVEVPSEVRPGEQFTLILRGNNYQDVNSSFKMTYRIQSTDLTFVKNIDPAQQTIEVSQKQAYILSPVEVNISTSKIESPPSKFTISVSQISNIGGQDLSSSVQSVEIQIDNTPFPVKDVVVSIISLVGFLLGIFGARIFS